MQTLLGKIPPFLRNTLIAVILMAAVYAYHNYKVSQEDRSVPPFTALYIDGLMNVYLQPGAKEKLTIKADDHILSQVKTVVENGVLKIYTEGLIQRERVKDAYLTYVHLDSIHAAGVGTLTSRDILPLDSFLLRASRSAEVRLQIQAKQLDLQMQDNANVQLAGSVNEFLCRIDDHGDMMAYNLKANKAKVNLITGPQSPGVARIHVLDSLWANVSGPRYLYYKGEPRFVQEVVDGQGKVMKK